MTSVGAARRGAVYSVLGFCTDAAFSAVHDRIRGKDLQLRTSAWMFPIYALVLPLYEPLHERVRRLPLPVRATAYGLGFLTVEYASGAALRRTTGEAPWDYSYARTHVNGLIRPDYFFFWAAAGLALEPLHDHLAGSGA